MTFSSQEMRSDVLRDVHSIDSSRTTQNNTAAPRHNLTLNKSVDLSSKHTQMMREASLKMLNRGGKKIDLQNPMKKSVLGAHMTN